MSANKRKRFQRACELLREVNNGRYLPPSINGRGRWSLKNPTIRYIIARGMAKLVRRPKGNWNRTITNTKIDTGVPWAREYRRGDGQ